MKSLRLAILALVMTPLCGHAYEEDLQPPDATIYVDALGTRADFGDYDGGYENGFALRIGAQFNDSGWGRWHWRAELSMNQFGEGQSRKSVVTKTPLPPVQTTEDTTTTKTRINGFGLGLSLYDSELFFVRAGALLFTSKSSIETQTTQYDGLGNVVNSFSQTPSSDTVSDIGGYAGAGIEFPVFDKSTSLSLEYDNYWIDSHSLPRLAAGFKFRF